MPDSFSQGVGRLAAEKEGTGDGTVFTPLVKELNNAPATRAAAIVPHDSDPLDEVPRAIFVGTGGHITLRGADDEVDVVFKNVADGSLLPFRPEFVRATGTTAQDLVAIL